MKYYALVKKGYGVVQTGRTIVETLTPKSGGVFDEIELCYHEASHGNLVLMETDRLTFIHGFDAGMSDYLVDVNKVKGIPVM